jgi:ribosomal protein L37AE/L43A
MSVGVCKVCGGEIAEAFSLGAHWYCKKCGIAYHSITKETATKEGQYLVDR